MKNTFLKKFIHRYPKVTLIGMSGLGKSHWSQLMVTYGYERLCCDDAIAYQLADLGKNQRTRKLGDWMGFPYEPGYKRKEKDYLLLEIKVLYEFIERLAKADPEEKIVIDTTGSAPYAGDKIMNQLRKQSCVIYLAASKEYYSEMLERYVRFPRPVLWGDQFRQDQFESKEEALARSYEKLIIYRDKLYRKYGGWTPRVGQPDG